MKKILAVVVYIVSVFALLPEANAQAIYGANGQYLGMAQTSGNTTNFYDEKGRFTGSFQENLGQTDIYNAQGQFKGYIDAPVQPQQQSNMYIVPQIPQVPRVRSF